MTRESLQPNRSTLARRRCGFASGGGPFLTRQCAGRRSSPFKRFSRNGNQPLPVVRKSQLGRKSFRFLASVTFISRQQSRSDRAGRRAFWNCRFQRSALERRHELRAGTEELRRSSGASGIASIYVTRIQMPGCRIPPADWLPETPETFAAANFASGRKWLA